MSKTDFQNLRQDYDKDQLDIDKINPNPILQFQQWFEDIRETSCPETNAMILATADKHGRPSVRTVLLKGVDEAGFIFYSNYESRKGRELAENSQAALLFYWGELHRQVRIEGPVEKIGQVASEAYFSSRPRGSRIGAWASPQSEVLENRQVLEARVAEYEEKFADDVPLPPFWGGYRVKPERIEFWQGRKSRLHDRLLFRREGNDWRIERLAP